MSIRPRSPTPPTCLPGGSADPLHPRSPLRLLSGVAALLALALLSPVHAAEDDGLGDAGTDAGEGGGDPPAEGEAGDEAPAEEGGEEGDKKKDKKGKDKEAPEGESPEAQTGERLPKAARLPAVRVRAVGFVDPYADGERQPGYGEDCDTLDGRRGECTERVRFAPMGAAFETRQPEGPTGEAWKAVLRNTSSLYLWTWDDLAMRWFSEDDPVAVVREDGAEALPQPSDQWGQARPEDRRLISLPNEDAWLLTDTWVEEGEEGDPEPFFPLVDYHPLPRGAQKDTKGLPLLPEMALMKGRFAERLGFNSQPHPYDIMDADEESSGPFFEQIFPYNTSRRADRPTSVRPLARFQDPEQLLRAELNESLAPHERPILLDGGFNEFETLAGKNFEEFSRLLGVTVARYALLDHTENQMRILTALTAMRSPPDADLMTKGRYRGLVAAARGETDSDEQLGFDFQRALAGLSGGFALKLRQLPEPVRRDWLNRLVAETIQSEAADRPRLKTSALDLIQDAERRLRNDEVIGPLGLAPGPRLLGLDSNAVRAFLDDAVIQKSRLRPFVYEDAYAVVLGAVLDGLQADERDLYETWLLLDHIDFAIAERMRAVGGSAQPPAAVAALGEKEFSKVLELHGRKSNLVSQGLQAVDPLAICTREPGRAALAEPSIKPVLVDILIAGPDPSGENVPAGEQVNPADVLWAARDNVPFMAVDDPEQALPTVTRLVDLPGPESIYRARWRLWSGWHILWGPQPVGPERIRLAARTAAFCEDTVLAPRDLVPTVVRSALLAGELFPTEPFRWSDMERSERKTAKRNLRLEGTVSGEVDLASGLAGGVSTAAQTAAGGVKDVKEVKAEGVGAMQGQDLQGEAVNLTRTQDTALGSGSLGQLGPGEAANYLHGIVYPPLRALSARIGGLVLMVFDHDIAADNRKGGDAFRPRTPYRRVQRRAPGEPREVRSAAWALYFPPPGAKSGVAMVGPAWRETDLVNNREHPVPRWKTRRPGDWTLMSSLSLFPYRQVETSCTDDPTWFDTVAPCASQVQTSDPNGLPTYHSEGFGVDLGGMFTWWGLHKPRMALETGLEGRLDVVPSGSSFFREDEPGYAWSFRPAVGPLFGIRFAPRPYALWRRGDQRSTWGPQRSEGGNMVGRTQFGLRSGVLFGPGFSGLEATIVTELWTGRSIRRIRSVHQSFTPYHPATMLGPFIRAQYSIPMPFVEPVPGHQVLDHAWTVVIGARANIRIKSQGPTLPQTAP